MASSTKRKTLLKNRTHSRESYRLWFEFLKRAIARDRNSVKLKLYKSWGDVESLSFNKWWDEIGNAVTNSNQSSK